MSSSTSNYDIWYQVYSYIVPKYVLDDWVEPVAPKLSLHKICKIYNALDYIKSNNYDLDWRCITSLCQNQNPEAIDMIFTSNQILDYIDVYELYSNPISIEIIKEKIKLNTHDNDDRRFDILWYQLCKNPHPDAIALIKSDMITDQDGRWNCNCIDDYECICEEIECWSALCANTNPEAIEILQTHINALTPKCWETLCSNYSAYPIIKENLDQIDEWGWSEMCSNTNPDVINLLSSHIDLIDWSILSANPAAIDILKQNLDKVDWSSLSTNPAAIDLLKNNIEKVDLEQLSGNSAIFVKNYFKIEKEVNKLLELYPPTRNGAIGAHRSPSEPIGAHRSPSETIGAHRSPSETIGER